MVLFHHLIYYKFANKYCYGAIPLSICCSNSFAVMLYSLAVSLKSFIFTLSSKLSGLVGFKDGLIQSLFNSL